MFKFKVLLAALTLASLITVGCNENTDVVTDTVPAAPTSFMATSYGVDKIGLKWTAPTGTYTGYKLKMSAAGMSDTTFTFSSATQPPFVISGLTEGVKYTFALSSVNGTLVSTTAPTMTWSPATRFTKDASGNDIRVYENASSKGSGLSLYNPLTGFPEVLNVNPTGSLWDIGIDLDETTDILDAGSPGALNFKINNPRVTLVGQLHSNVSSLDSIFESADLSVSQQGAYPLNNVTTGGYAFVVKTADGNYAKVLIKSQLGKLLQGTKGDRYVNMEISYQKTAGVPHAETNSIGGK